MRKDLHSVTGSAPVAGAAGTALLMPGQRALLARYDVALLDLDGVVYAGRAAVPGAVTALAAARAAGLRLAFVTNNASRSPSAVAEHLVSLGVPASAADVVTSAQAAAGLIASRFPAGSPVLVAGAMALRLALRERGLRPVSVAAERPVAVVQGFTPDLSYRLLTEAALAISGGAEGARLAARHGLLGAGHRHGDGGGAGGARQAGAAVARRGGRQDRGATRARGR